MSSQPLLEKLLNSACPRWSPTMYKVTLGGAIVSAVAVPLALVAVPFIEFFNGMAVQPKGKSQMTYGRTFHVDAIVERSPAAGTLPRDHYPYAYQELGNTVEAVQEAGRHMENPVPIVMENLRRGQELYNVFCIVCHGTLGDGDGPVVGPNRFPAPPSLHTKQAREYTDGSIYHIATMGLGRMPSYADKLDPQERWMVVHYLRAMQRAMAPKPEDLNP